MFLGLVRLYCLFKSNYLDNIHKWWSRRDTWRSLFFTPYRKNILFTGLGGLGPPSLLCHESNIPRWLPSGLMSRQAKPSFLPSIQCGCFDRMCWIDLGLKVTFLCLPCLWWMSQSPWSMHWIWAWQHESQSKEQSSFVPMYQWDSNPPLGGRGCIFLVFSVGHFRC